MNLDQYKDLHGKNTLEVARILADEFVKRYGGNWGSEADILKRLLPRGKANTWSALDRNINQFCKQFYHSWNHDEDKISFLDEVRFAFASLPMKRDYKLPEQQTKSTSPEYITQFFETCSLCWRSVLRKPLEKKTPLCHLHDLPSTHPVYRRRARAKKQMEAIRLNLIKSLPPLVQKDSEGKLNTYVTSLCLNPNGALPKLSGYLLSLDMPLNTGQKIMRALESPINLKRASSLVAQAWEFYLDDRGEHFRLNYLQLLNAEAWLRAEEERKHGGKRR